MVRFGVQEKRSKNRTEPNLTITTDVYLSSFLYLPAPFHCPPAQHRPPDAFRSTQSVIVGFFSSASRQYTSYSASPGSMSVPDLSTTAAEDGGIPKPSLRKGKDVGPLTVNRAIHANTMTALDLPPQSLSLPTEADSDMAAVAGPSQRAERTGDHSPHPSHCRYDIV
ncbi:hypothetical protein EDB83DRAFT_2318696 [Lactarius deliciosus]|nr:hypothetical protein EDB83DRAFT_2318696 [Lactarius deliciosus]